MPNANPAASTQQAHRGTDLLIRWRLVWPAAGCGQALGERRPPDGLGPHWQDHHRQTPSKAQQDLPCLTLVPTCQPPVASRRSTRWRPKKPAPPVTRQRWERVVLRRVATMPCQVGSLLARGCAARLAAADAPGCREGGCLLTCSACSGSCAPAILQRWAAAGPLVGIPRTHAAPRHNRHALSKHAQCVHTAKARFTDNSTKGAHVLYDGLKVPGVASNEDCHHDWDGDVAAELEHLEAAIPSHATCPCLTRRACRQKLAASSVLAHLQHSSLPTL